jgi:CO/xanthine dehydrogenase FAD-binding subunit
VRAADFFLGYRRVALAPHEVLQRVAVPFTRRHEFVREFKQAHRRDDDVAIVNAGMRARMRRNLAGAARRRPPCDARVGAYACRPAPRCALARAPGLCVRRGASAPVRLSSGSPLQFEHVS